MVPSEQVRNQITGFLTETCKVRHLFEHTIILVQIQWTLVTYSVVECHNL